MFESNVKKIIVTHPHKQHSFQTAIAIKKIGLLFKYVTTVYDKEKSITAKIKKILIGNNLKKANSRKCNQLDDTEVKLFKEIIGIFHLILIRIPKSINVSRKWDRYIERSFGKKVANYAVENNVMAVISYDRYSSTCFRILKKKAPHIKRILDVSIVTTPYMKNTFEKDILNYNSEELKKDNLFLWDKKVMNNYIEEIQNSDYFLAPSDVVKKSLLFCGVKEDKIKLIPYGVDIDNFSYSKKLKKSGKLKLIFVGRVDSRKGIHHLLNVMKKFNNDEIELEIIGGYDDKSKLYLENEKVSNVIFSGFLNKEELVKKYHEADVFVLPSLGEGMALVGLEALSTGTPMICSDESGVNDVIVEGKNGFVFKAGDDKDLEIKIRYFLNNRHEIPSMSEYARKTAESYSWNLYRQRVKEMVQELIIEIK